MMASPVPPEYRFAEGEVLLPVSGSWGRVRSKSESRWAVSRHHGLTKDRCDELDNRVWVLDLMVTSSYAYVGGVRGGVGAGLWTKNRMVNCEFVVLKGVDDYTIRRRLLPNDDYTGPAEYKDDLESYTYTVSLDGSILTRVHTLTRRGKTLGSYTQVLERRETYEATVAKVGGKPYSAPVGGLGDGTPAVHEMEAKVAELEVQSKSTQDDAASAAAAKGDRAKAADDEAKDAEAAKEGAEAAKDDAEAPK